MLNHNPPKKWIAGFGVLQQCVIYNYCHNCNIIVALHLGYAINVKHNTGLLACTNEYPCGLGPP